MTTKEQQIIREDFFLNGDPGIQVFVREVKDGAMQHRQKGPVLLLHGARLWSRFLKEVVSFLTEEV